MKGCDTTMISEAIVDQAVFDFWLQHKLQCVVINKEPYLRYLCSLNNRVLWFSSLKVVKQILFLPSYILVLSAIEADAS